MKLRPFRYASGQELLFMLALLGLPRVLLAAPSTQPSTKPAFVTSDPDGMWNDHGYIIHNNMWNAKKYRVAQTLRAYGHNEWSVTATADNSKHDGAVKTYPNVHKDYHNWKTGNEPRLSSFAAITNTFAASSPHVGIYNVAYDIWLNGVPGNCEVMIWTENFHQVPAGRAIATGVTFSGHAWDVYATRDNHYLALVARQPLTHGSLDLKEMLDYLTRQVGSSLTPPWAQSTSAWSSCQRAASRRHSPSAISRSRTGGRPRDRPDGAWEIDARRPTATLLFSFGRIHHESP